MEMTHAPLSPPAAGQSDRHLSRQRCQVDSDCSEGGRSAVYQGFTAEQQHTLYIVFDSHTMLVKAWSGVFLGIAY